LVPLVDLHVHLLAGIDDGPQNIDDAVAMCRIAHEDGVQAVAATAHQNERWKDVTPDRIRAATEGLRKALDAARIPLLVLPNAEVMVTPSTVEDWNNGKLMSVADRKRHLLIEMPHGTFVDLLPLVRNLRRVGLQPILAHPERQAEFLHDEGRIEALLAEDCLVQVSAASITHPQDRSDLQAIQDWFKRGMVHLLGSDGHSPRRRRPLVADAYRRIAEWIGLVEADNIASGNGRAVLDGQTIRVRPPAPPRRRWFSIGRWLG
jgi:protein-tyrosine phosphatase